MKKRLGCVSVEVPTLVFTSDRYEHTRDAQAEYLRLHKNVTRTIVPGQTWLFTNNNTLWIYTDQENGRMSPDVP